MPKNDFILMEKEEKQESENNQSIDVSEITRTTYYCNLISDTTRGGRNTIPYDEVRKYRDELMNQSTSIFNTYFLTPFEFAYMFIFTCHKKGIKSFNSYDLLIKIIEKYNSKPEYLPLLWNIDCSCGEHDDESDSLFNAFALLRYIGLIHPDYDSKYQNIDLIIDDYIDKFPSIIASKKSYLPLMKQLVNGYLELSNNKGNCLKKILFR